MSVQPRAGGGFATAPVTTKEAPAVVTSPPFTFTFDGYAVDNYRVLTPDQVNPAYQVALIVRGTTEFAGTLTVYQPGAFDTAKFRSGTRVNVQGREAFQSQLEHKQLTQWRADGYTNTDIIKTDALAWQYAPGAWAVIDSELYPGAGQPPFAAADQVKLAERFQPRAGDPVAARLPFRPGYLPAGFELLSVDGQSMSAQGRGMVTFVYAGPDPSFDVVDGPRDFHNTSPVPAAVISILWVDDPPPDAVARTSRCNDGRHWCQRNLPGNEFWVAISDPTKTLSDGELLKIVDSLTFATINDPATWYATS